MELPDLPDDILSKIVRYVGEDQWWLLGPIIRAGRRGRNLVYDEHVLKHANIGGMCQDPVDVAVGGRFRSFFSRCLRAGNIDSFYYEGLRLVAEGNDIKGGIKLLDKTVPADGDATFACAIFAICAGDESKSLHYLKIFHERHQRLGTNGVRRYGIRLLHLLSYYRLRRNAYCSRWLFPNSNFIPSPACAIECGIACAGDENFCNNCYLWWFAREVCGMLE